NDRSHAFPPFNNCQKCAIAVKPPARGQDRRRAAYHVASDLNKKQRKFFDFWMIHDCLIARPIGSAPSPPFGP
ncbi:MAG: hypothetical protein RMJ35_08605, partial [Phycisphaerales bacterium]|nr:hypothetical protein [Phycisphaerales bacterium]